MTHERGLRHLGKRQPEPAKPRVRLVGEDGNVFAILGRVIQALRQAGYSTEEIARYRAEATSRDYTICFGSPWSGAAGLTEVAAYPPYVVP